MREDLTGAALQNHFLEERYNLLAREVALAMQFGRCTARFYK
jgi:hypothetical protein